MMDHKLNFAWTRGLLEWNPNVAVIQLLEPFFAIRRERPSGPDIPAFPRVYLYLSFVVQKRLNSWKGYLRVSVLAAGSKRPSL